MQRRLFASSTLVACLVAAAGCTGSTDEASISSQITEATTLSWVVAEHVRGTDFSAIARGLNPIVHTGRGCGGIVALVDTVEHGAVDVQVTPTAAGSATRITVAAPAFHGRIEYRQACLTFRAPFTLFATAYVIDGVVVPRVQSGALAVVFDGAAGRFDNINIDVSGVPGNVVTELVRTAQPHLARGLSRTIAAGLPPVVDQFLAGPALSELAGSIADAITATDLDAVLRVMNPIVDTGGGCVSVRASVSSATHGAGEAVFGPTPDGLDTSASVSAVAVLGPVDFRILCITGRASFLVTADAYRVDGLTTLGVDGASVVASLQTSRSTVENFAIDIAGSPSAVVDLLLPRLHAQLTAVIGNQVAQLLPPRVAQFFNDFLSH
jgi:hypothetical protein